MTDDGRRERAGATRRGSPRLTRRDVLGLAGAATVVGTGALAGCSAVPGLGPDPVELDGTAVADVADGPVPSVAEPLPVDVADAHVADSRERAEAALASVPLPLSAAELPNGSMRREIASEVEHARVLLASASEASGVRERLSELRHARQHTGAVAAAWAYTQNELTLADVRERGERVRADARTFREEWAYVGADPARALLVHDAVESLAGEARRYAAFDRATRGRQVANNAIDVGEFAGEVDRGRAAVADATHVGERFTASLSDPTSLRSTLVAARESLLETLEARRSEFPDEVNDPNELVDVDRDLQGTPAGVALDDLHWRIPTGLEPTDDLAGDVVARARGLTYAAAFAALRDRVADGETFTVASVEDLRDRRSAAVTAIDAAVEESGDERLARRLLARPAHWTADADEDLGRYDEPVEARTLAHEIGNYVALAFYARAVPEAVGEALDALGVDG